MSVRPWAGRDGGEECGIWIVKGGKGKVGPRNGSRLEGERRTSLQDFRGGFQGSDVKKMRCHDLKFPSLFRGFEEMVFILSLLPAAHMEM